MKERLWIEALQSEGSASTTLERKYLSEFVRRSSRSKRASEGGGNQAESLERAEGAVGSRGDGDGGSVARRERTRESRKEVDDVGDTSKGQAGEERVHLLRVRGTSSRGGGRKAALPTQVAARVRTVRGGASAVSA